VLPHSTHALWSHALRLEGLRKHDRTHRAHDASGLDEHEATAVLKRRGSFRALRHLHCPTGRLGAAEPALRDPRIEKNEIVVKY